MIKLIISKHSDNFCEGIEGVTDRPDPTIEKKICFCYHVHMEKLYETEYAGQVFFFRILRSDRKTIALQIREGAILVRAPRRASTDMIREFVDSHSAWIAKTMERQSRQTVPKMLDEAERKRLRQRAGEMIRERVEYYAPKMGVTYNRIFIKEQKTRWGSYSSSGNLNFNWKLILIDEELLDYVVVHELAHRKQMNHSPQFWQEVEKILPDYKERRKRLKEFRL